MYYQSLFVVTLILFVSVNGDHGHGHSNVYRKQEGKKYEFGYHVHDPWGSHFQKESGDPWEKHGSYGLKLADGRERVVKYVADKGGFRAKIETNEPGTGSVDAADAIYNGDDPGGYSLTHVPSGHDGHGGHGGHHNYHDGGHGHENGEGGEIYDGYLGD